MRESESQFAGQLTDRLAVVDLIGATTEQTRLVIVVSTTDRYRQPGERRIHIKMIDRPFSRL